ncbi:AraC family transcriptional regulator [Mycetocola saprophilus]|uniref:AraC family transcriptional regulator n=1 Tax=Mycetocola saprophilus TaxID=76636 RepID=UPI000B1615AF|nr:AraC family transcriptional regulator [Mycetocola saprophilus]
MSEARKRLLSPHTADNSISDRAYFGPEGVAMLAASDGVTTGDAEHFDLRTRVARIGYFRIQSILTTALNVSLATDHYDAPDKVRFTFVREGRLEIDQRGRHVVLTPGDAVIGFDTVPAQIVLPERTRYVTITVDRELLFPAGLADERQMRYIRRDELFNGATASFFEALLRPAAFPLAPVDELRVSRTITKMLNEVFVATLPSQDSVATRRAEERAVVRGYIGAHFTRADLSVSSIAAHYGMSPRSLQRLYSDYGENVSNVIRKRRLEHAVSMLMDRRFDDVSIDDVAIRSGFAGANQLRRVMNQVMEQTPTQLRAVHGGRDEGGESGSD